MNDTPTTNNMNLYLLSIPFAVLGVAIAVVPLLIGMSHEARTKHQDVEPRVMPLSARDRVKEFERAA